MRVSTFASAAMVAGILSLSVGPVIAEHKPVGITSDIMKVTVLKFGYPAHKIKWYRGGMQDWYLLGLTTTEPSSQEDSGTR